MGVAHRSGRVTASHSFESFHLCFCAVLVPLATLMVVLDVSKKPLEVTLVLRSIFMLFALERSVLDVGCAVLAPILGLWTQSVRVACGHSRARSACSDLPSTSSIPTW
jgi:hypothetical protein